MWPRGKPHSDETREKMRKAREHVVYTEEWRKRMSEAAKKNWELRKSGKQKWPK